MVGNDEADLSLTSLSPHASAKRGQLLELCLRLCVFRRCVAVDDDGVVEYENASALVITPHAFALGYAVAPPYVFPNIVSASFAQNGWSMALFPSRSTLGTKSTIRTRLPPGSSFNNDQYRSTTRRGQATSRRNVIRPRLIIRRAHLSTATHSEGRQAPHAHDRRWIAAVAPHRS